MFLFISNYITQFIFISSATFGSISAVFCRLYFRGIADYGD